MFDPAHRTELEERIADSDFIHLWNEIWGRVRLPKHHGPPEGSFLDGLFRRFGMGFADEARLSIETITVWFRERNLLDQLRWRLRTELLPANAIDQVIEQERREAAPRLFAFARSIRERRHASTRGTSSADAAHLLAWRGDRNLPAPLPAKLPRSRPSHRAVLLDRGLDLPDWITLRDAAEILPRERVLALPRAKAICGPRGSLPPRLAAPFGRLVDRSRRGPAQGRTASPDFWFSPAFESGAISTAALKFPAGHPVLTEALVQAPSFEAQIEDSGKAGALLLTNSLAAMGVTGARHAHHGACPLPSSDVPRLFDPSQADALAKELDGERFLDLHQEVWLRAGVPDFLGPPRGSFLTGYSSGTTSG